MFLQRYLDYLPILIAAVIFFAVALVLWLTGRRALASSHGGLDWVRDYRTSGFDFTTLHRSRQDWLCLFAVVVFALIFSAGVIALNSEYALGIWVHRLYRPKNLCKLVLYAGGAFSVCWLLQMLFKDNTLALCGGILSALSFAGSRAAILVFFISLLLFVCWYAQDSKAPLFPGILLLLGSCVMLGVAASRLDGFAWIGVGYLILHLVKGIRRINDSDGALWEVILMPLCGILIFFISFVGAKLATVYTSGAVSLSGMFGVLTPNFVLRMLKRLLLLPAEIVTRPIQRQLLLCALLDAPLLAGGFFGFFVALRTARDRHDASALLCVVLMAALAVAWIFSRQYVLVPGLVLCTVCLLRRFTAAEKKAPVIAYTALSCAYYIVFYIWIYLLSGPVAIADIIA